MKSLLRYLRRRSDAAPGLPQRQARAEESESLEEETSARAQMMALGLTLDGAENWLSASRYPNSNGTVIVPAPYPTLLAQAVTELLAADVPLALLEQLGEVIAAANLKTHGVVNDVIRDLIDVVALEAGRSDRCLDGRPSCVGALDRPASEEYLAHLAAGWDSADALGLVSLGLPSALAGTAARGVTTDLYSRWLEAVDGLNYDVPSLRRWAPVVTASRTLRGETVREWHRKDPIHGHLLAGAGIAFEEYVADPARFGDVAALAAMAALRADVA